jgi:hypothetical protein
VLGESGEVPQIRPCDAHPPVEADTSDNARSLGYVLTLGDFEFLNLGDLTWNVEHRLACPKNLVGTVDAMQVTHHGSDQSNNPALVGAVAPTVAVVNNGPKKGGTARVYATLRATASITDIFQVHRNVETGPGDNAPPGFAANDEEACNGEWVRLSVGPSAKSYAVEIPSKGTRRTYDVR